MRYSLSQIDKDNARWFENDRTRNSLVGIEVAKGNIRGIYPCKIEFKYPISTFVGENGSGKSTLLALSACAFHNDDSFVQFSRKKSYFTYGNFFAFSPVETGLNDIEIMYKIRQTEDDILNIRRKKPSGKWNDYNTRKNRNVIYLGINRIVPPSESSAHHSYRKAFELEEIDEAVLMKIRIMLSSIFGKNYDELSISVHNIYRLYFTKRNEIVYSGFNMGAGENAVISILLELLNAGPGALMVIDEIELGLHAKAQKELMRVLKDICNSNKCQIICSTHSDIILNAIPPEGRFFIQNLGSQTIVTPEISAEYAFGKLAGQNSGELDIFVEDNVGKAIIENIIPKNIRERVQLIVIGSDQAVLKQVAARYREGKTNFIAFLDGDKRTAHNQQISQVRNHLEARIDDENQFEKDIHQRLQYIPGSNWPEYSIISVIRDSGQLEALTERWGAENDDELKHILEQALTAGKHNEFYSIAQQVSKIESDIRTDCVHCYKSICAKECAAVYGFIKQTLDSL